MRRLTIKQWGAVVAAAIAVAATGVSANFIWDSDVNGTSNATLWDSYAYYYLEGYYNTKPNLDDDPADAWPNHHLACFATRTCRIETSNKEQIVSAKKEPDADGEWPYQYDAASERAFYMEFAGLSKFSANYAINPEAGMGLLLSAKAGGDNPQGIGAGFQNVTEIKWKMKLSSDIKVIRFKVETIKTSKEPARDNAFGKVFENKTPGQWMECSVKLTPVASGCETVAKWDEKTGIFDVSKCKVGDLTLADYFGGGYKFDPTEVTKIAWQIATGGMQLDNATLTKGQVWIDKVEIVGYDYKAPDICTECVGAPTVAAPAGAWKVSDFEAPDYAQNTIGNYWWYYNDVEIGGASDASGGIKEDEYSPTGYSLDIQGNNKGYSGSEGAWIPYLLGNAVEKDGNTVDPFVGLGTELFKTNDGGDTLLYDAGSVADAGVYFLYKTDFGASNYLWFEVHDAYAFRNPDGGEVYGVRLPGTGGEWKSATVPFSKLQLPSWAPKHRTGEYLAFNKGAIAKLQFVAKGSPQSGEIAVDNVYIKGAEGWADIPNVPISVKYAGKAAKAAGMRVAYSRGAIGVNWTSAASVANGRVALVNTKGRVVASAPIAAAGNKVTAKLGAGNIPTGMYFVRITAKDANGKRIVQQAPVSVVK